MTNYSNCIQIFNIRFRIKKTFFEKEHKKRNKYEPPVKS